MNKVDLILTNNLGQSTIVDVNDFPYRLNRNVFSASNDKLKVLGGTFSTQIELSKSKRNNQFFVGKTEVKSTKKFYNLNFYDAVLYENGVEVVRGKFKLEEILNDRYLGTFFDNDIDWVDNLNNIKLNQLGYVNGQPTWLVPFDGAPSFDIVNEQTNRETDYICPTLIYNNTPLADYVDLTDEDIWGTYEVNPSPPPAFLKLKSGGDYPNDFKTETGFFGDRLGLTFEDFPPALYYRNVLERCIHEIGFEIECPLFNEEWFNKLYMTYGGDGYKYNWKHIAKAASYTPYVLQVDMDVFDDVYKLDELDLQNVQCIPACNWIANPQAKFKMADIIKHDDPTSLIFEDHITAFNKFNIPGQYICPTDGRYNIRVGSGYETYIENLVDISGGTLWQGYQLFFAYASQDAESPIGVMPVNRHYGWDDSVMIIVRKNQNDNFPYADTNEMLSKWMSGENKDFINNPSDIIAYFSPKRYQFYLDGFITNEREFKGSPINNFTEEVTVYNNEHIVWSDTPSLLNSTSYGEIEVNVDLLKNERIEIHWISLGNIYGNAVFAGDAYTPAALDSTQKQMFGETVVETDPDKHFFTINYLCGEYDLDLAANLPDITVKQFLTSFINQFNLYFNLNGNVIQFLPQQNYYTPETYDITSRVLNDNWSCQPLTTPKELNIGYNIDDNDRFLSNIVSNCVTDDSFVSDYGNVILYNDNIYGNDFLNNNTIFSSTQFYNGKIQMWPYASVVITIPYSVDLGTFFVLFKGFEFSLAGPAEFYMDIPSIQSQSSFNEKTVGDLNYDYNYVPRLLYHLGTVTDYLGVDPLQGALIDSPRAEEAFCRLPKHWYRPTVSAFHEENNNPYRTLRYDTDNGLYNVYFENLVDLYNQSEVLTLKMAMRNIDWINMKGSKKIKYLDGLYRLMSIKDYDPLTNKPCTIKLLKEI